MGPKKDTKKKSGKSDGPITVDPADFTREETELPVLGGVSNIDTTLSGEFFNVEELFPEWNDEEVWTDLPEILKTFQISYPNTIQITDQKSVAQHLGLKIDHEADNKKGAKKPPKEFSLDDAIFHEDGTPLPRVFIGTDPTEGSDQYLSHNLNITFQKNWTSDQLHRKAALEETSLAHLSISAPSSSSAAPAVMEAPPSSASGSKHPIKEPPGSKESARPASKEVKKQQVPARAISPAMKKTEGDDTLGTITPPPPVFTESPQGEEIDSLLCHVFRLIERFYPSLVDSSGHGTPPPFLWRAIHPQLPSGKPCYNKCGKYCVKLFVGGKWRKVTINDTLPVDNGFVAIASSSNPLELWPTILSKAIYTVYTACGYQHTMSDLSHQRSNLTSVSSFLSFALHSLTGWLPSTPCSLKNIFEINSNRLQTILDEIALGGAVVVKKEEIPTEEAILMLPDPDNENRQRTKKQLRDLLLRKKMEKENLIRDLHLREAMVKTIEDSLNRPFGETYILHAVSPTEGQDRILPILGICTPDPANIRSIMFLTQWKKSPMVYSEGSNAEDVPGSTPVIYEWILLEDLCHNYQQVYLCSLDTRLRSSFVADWSWHWGEVTEKVEEGKGKGKKEVKGKEKKGPDATSSSAVLGTPSRGQDRGVFPPVLMKIDPQTLFESLDPSIAYFSLSVNIQSDLVSPQQNDHDHHHNDHNHNNHNHDGSSESSGKRNPFVVIDDAVLVLQEIRTDSEDPLVMRVQLAKEDLTFPINRITFNIPLQRFPHDPVLFWVRIFSKSSLFLSFHSPAPIEVMEAKNIWQNVGGMVWELSGTTLPTYSKTEQLLFRIPVQFVSSPENGEDSVLLFLHTTNRAISDTLSLVAIDHQTGHSHVLPNINGNCFHLSSTNQITLIGRCFHNSLNIPEFSWKASILSRQPIISPESKLNCLISTEKGSKQRFLGSYTPNNQLRIFRDILTVELADFPLALRLSCHFLAEDQNHENINLRTITSTAHVGEHLWFVVRILRRSDRQIIHEFFSRSLLQIYLLEREGLVIEQEGQEMENEKKNDKKTDKKNEKKKKGEVETVDFIIDVLIDETKMCVPQEWKSRYPFKFQKYRLGSELGDMDEKLAEGGGSGGGAQSQPREIQFHWQLDVLAGQILKMQHDTYDLERYAAMKNKWEDEGPGRRARALAGRSYWQTRSSTQTIDDTVIDKLGSDLGEALDKDEIVITQRERQIKFLPKYRENIQPMVPNENEKNKRREDGGAEAGEEGEGEGEATTGKELLSQEILTQEKAYLHQEIQKWKENANENNLKLTEFNERFRNDTLGRVKVIQEQVAGSYEEAIRVWSLREGYKANIEKKNESLGYLLQRSSEALITAFPNENEDPKAKKKGKK